MKVRNYENLVPIKIYVRYDLRNGIGLHLGSRLINLDTHYMLQLKHGQRELWALTVSSPRA